MKKLLIYTFFSVTVFGVSAQNIEQAFINLPEIYLPLLSKEQRTELLFNQHLAKSDSVINNLKGVSRLQLFDRENEYIKIALTEKSTFEMKIWKLNDTTKIIGFSHTVCAPVCDSQVAFFDKNFKRTDTEKMFPDIAIQDFLNKEKISADGESVENIVKKHDALFATISFSPANNDIVLKSNVKEFLSKEIYPNIEQYLLGNTVILTWENGIFKKGGAVWK